MQQDAERQEIMRRLSKGRSLFQAMKWLNTCDGQLKKSPADLIKSGQSSKALTLLVEKKSQ